MPGANELIIKKRRECILESESKDTVSNIFSAVSLSKTQLSSFFQKKGKTFIASYNTSKKLYP